MVKKDYYGQVMGVEHLPAQRYITYKNKQYYNHYGTGGDKIFWCVCFRNKYGWGDHKDVKDKKLIKELEKQKIIEDL